MARPLVHPLHWRWLVRWRHVECIWKIVSSAVVLAVPEIFFCTVEKKPSKAKYYVDETSEVPKLLYICHVLIFTSSNQNIICIFIIVTRTRIIEPTGKIFQFKVSVINWTLMLRRKLRKGYFPDLIFWCMVRGQRRLIMIFWRINSVGKDFTSISLFFNW